MARLSSLRISVGVWAPRLVDMARPLKLTLLLDAQKRGAAILFVTHQQEIIRKLGASALHLRDGHMTTLAPQRQSEETDVFSLRSATALD